MRISVRVPSALMLALCLPGCAALAQTFEVYHSFYLPGGTPAGTPLVSSSGILYGTEKDGGDFRQGSVYSLTPDGSGGFVIETLHSFSGPDGSAPGTTPVFGPAGNLNGTTFAGGAANAGTVFRVTPSGSLTRLHDFADGGGSGPSGLILASNGAYYGTTSSGGAHGGGTVFRVNPDETVSVMHDFDGSVEGSSPQAGLAQVGSLLYGTTSVGGSANDGTAFQMDLSGNLTTIHEFNGTDGSNPLAALTLGVDGNLYGTTQLGGTDGLGTVFKMDLSGTVTTLHNFAFSDGSAPEAALFQWSDGKFYGTTAAGGTGGGKDMFPSGTIFRIDSLGNFQMIDSFISFFGSSNSPSSGIADGRDGFLYGTLSSGALYRVASTGSVSYAFFFDPGQGLYGPISPVTEANGALYGGTGTGDGAIYRLDANGVTTIHQFNTLDGYFPYAGLLLASDGNLYGTTNAGGSGQSGTAFRVDPSGTFELLHNFSDTEGADRISAFIESPPGTFIGAARAGGTSGAGTIYGMDTSGNVSPLHQFVGTEGINPEPSLVLATDGNFYGTTLYGGVPQMGNAFSMDATHTVTSIHDFQGTDGANPTAGLVQGAGANFYGATFNGGEHGLGTLFQMTGSGTVTTLHSFAGPDGSSPQATLVLGADGKLYGTTFGGGTYLNGTIFRTDTLGNYELLHEFQAVDGEGPTTSLIAASDGALYGTTTNGGLTGGGVVFRLVSGIPAPSPAAVAPTSGRAAGGTPFAVTGSHLYDAASATVGGVAVTPPVVLDQATIYTVSPPLTPGTLNDVTVQTSGALSGTLPAAWFADFTDVDGDDIFHSYVEAIFRAGITAGCGGGAYCRDAAVRRDQMAVFLLKAEHGSGYAPPACQGVFGDVACPGPFTDWVEQLAAEGVTAGCGGGDYCPTVPVTRAQMAVFLLKTKEGSTYVPPPAVGLFGDVAVSSPFAPWIEDLANRNITGGCQVSPPLYCPANPNTRGQMAVFLTKTFGLE